MVKNMARICALFCFCFAAGYSIIQYTTPDAETNSRDPASIGKIYDFSHLKGEDLSVAVKQRLLAGFEVIKGDGTQGIGLGHFVFVDSSGQKKFACQQFNKVTLTFIADGTAMSGETPEMTVEGSCDFSSDITKINPLWIPVAKILNEKPGDGDFQFNTEQTASIHFTNIPEEWPRTWLLKSVELTKDHEGDAVLIRSDEVSKYLGHPMILKF